MKIPYSDACERNKVAILNVVEHHLDSAETVLEIGSGTGQHAVHFCSLKPHLQWQTSDKSEYLEGINAQLAVAKLSNITYPVELDVNQPKWLEERASFDVIYTANTFHIMTESDVRAFFTGIIDVLSPDAKLIVYGPFKYQGQFTSNSNAAFDLSLRNRGVGSGIRDFEWVNELALKQGLTLLEDHKMPANNQCLVWQRRQDNVL